MRSFFKKQIKCFFLTFTVFCFFSHFTTAKADEFASPWPAEGVTFTTYQQFKDSFLSVLSISSPKRIIIISESITDGDIATALFRSKLKGASVLVILNAKQASHYLSRKNYFNSVGIPVSIMKSTYLHTNSISTAIIDDTAWQISSSFNEKDVRKPEVKKSSKTALELAELTVATVKQTAPSQKSGRSAKESTAEISAQSQPDTIKQVTRQPNRRSETRRGLPVETRLQKIMQGKSTDAVDTAKTQGSSLQPEPAPPRQESELPADAR